MQFTTTRIIVSMVSVFQEPYLQLGVQASDVMEQFYRAIQTPDRIPLRDLITSGGTSYADLRLTLNTFRGGGRIDITPGALIVELKDVISAAGHAEVAKEHLQLCEDTARKALKGLEISERLMRAGMWVSCEGGRPAMEAFLEEKGNAALKLEQPPYSALKKEFTLQFSGLDAARATKISLALERSSVADADLFVQFEHTRYGSPTLATTVTEQFEAAETELQALMGHMGLEPKKDDAAQP
ncbi:hypothetical protein [Hyphomicrobium sp. CS1BSMeth3]|uniref:hypothetical protein n=1 Tax=Hyphomicrobium sp. CS1BSMeth3 TaxID=1892844 RepID=UPI00092FFA04|nr:hypothetical protein [Hyphomicrobium sp. CS1BSMeth3]